MSAESIPLIEKEITNFDYINKMLEEVNDDDNIPENLKLIMNHTSAKPLPLFKRELLNLTLIQEMLKELNGNIPENIKLIQNDRAKKLEELKPMSQWEECIRHKCLLCGYIFGDDSCNFEEGRKKELIKKETNALKSIHEEICRSGIFTMINGLETQENTLPKKD